MDHTHQAIVTVGATKHGDKFFFQYKMLNPGSVMQVKMQIWKKNGIKFWRVEENRHDKRVEKEVAIPTKGPGTWNEDWKRQRVFGNGIKGSIIGNKV